MKQGLIALVVITLLLGGVYALGRGHGVSATEAYYTTQINEQTASAAATMKQARIESRKVLEKKEEALKQKLAESNKQLQELLGSNHEFNAWYQARAPTAVADVIYLERMQQ